MAKKVILAILAVLLLIPIVSAQSMGAISSEQNGFSKSRFALSEIIYVYSDRPCGSPYATVDVLVFPHKTGGWKDEDSLLNPRIKVQKGLNSQGHLPLTKLGSFTVNGGWDIIVDGKPKNGLYEGNECIDQSGSRDLNAGFETYVTGEVCAPVLTSAYNPETKQCFTFTNSCIWEDWTKGVCPYSLEEQQNAKPTLPAVQQPPKNELDSINQDLENLFSNITSNPMAILVIIIVSIALGAWWLDSKT